MPGSWRAKNSRSDYETAKFNGKDMHTSILAKLVARPIRFAPDDCDFPAMCRCSARSGSSLAQVWFAASIPFGLFCGDCHRVWVCGNRPRCARGCTLLFVTVKVGGAFSESYSIIYGVLALFLSRFSSSRRLGLKRTTFITRMQKLGIDPSSVLETGESGKDTHRDADLSITQPAPQT